MKNRHELRERYLRDPLSVRLGGLAANLARVCSFSKNSAHGDALARLLEESAWFVEWTAPDAPIDIQVALLDCQRILARWRASWARIWTEPKLRAEVAEQADKWSQRILGLSGLVQVTGSEPQSRTSA